MNDILQQQYTLVQSSRVVLLNFIETKVGAGLNARAPAFDGSTIRYLLVHNANCYLQWLAVFAQKEVIAQLNDQDFTTISQIRELFNLVDNTVVAFLKNFKSKMDIPVAGTLSRNREATVTPLQLFTHVTTHEFHHKGQIVSMCRLLGQIPPYTDIIRF